MVSEGCTESRSESEATCKLKRQISFRSSRFDETCMCYMQQQKIQSRPAKETAPSASRCCAASCSESRLACHNVATATRIQSRLSTETAARASGRRAASCSESKSTCHELRRAAIHLRPCDKSARAVLSKFLPLVVLPPIGQKSVMPRRRRASLTAS